MLSEDIQKENIWISAKCPI